MHSDSHYFIWVTNNRDGVIDMQMSTVRACKDSVGSQLVMRSSLASQLIGLWFWHTAAHYRVE